MAKKTTLYFCASCGYETGKWLGRCPGCREWNSFTEAPVPRVRGGAAVPVAADPVNLHSLAAAEEERYPTTCSELDRVLGGGVVAGSVVLLGGDPGIGKSTLLLQAAARLARTRPVFYASGEESLHQLKMRSDRLGISEPFQAAALTDLDSLLNMASSLKPAVLIADSVQSFSRAGLEGVPGSVGQVREVAAALVRLAKEQNIAVFLVGHVTKEGVIAGPRLLEHMVDCVLYLEGERYHSFRVLRGVKNRFGSTNEIGVFVMEAEGLTGVENPSHLFMTGRGAPAPGAMITAGLEGTRPLLVEIQALTAPTAYPAPRRTAAGIDLNRVALVMAVLEKHAKTSFFGMDTFVNVVGGVRLTEPAADLALAISLVSSLRGLGPPAGAVAAGEVGLTGEIRPVSHIRRRLAEAAKLGFTRFLFPAANRAELQTGPQPPPGLELIGAASINEALTAAFPPGP